MDQICPRRAFPFENKKTEQHHWIQHIRNILFTKFQLQLKILIFWTKLSQTGYFWPKTNHYWILHIWISLSIEFPLQLTILIFWAKFAQKADFRSKAEKVNITIEFCIFELVYNPGQNIWSKIEKSSKTGQDKKSLISTFACFLTATAKV